MTFASQHLSLNAGFAILSFFAHELEQSVDERYFCRLTKRYAYSNRCEGNQDRYKPPLFLLHHEKAKFLPKRKRLPAWFALVWRWRLNGCPYGRLRLARFGFAAFVHFGFTGFSPFLALPWVHMSSPSSRCLPWKKYSSPSSFRRSR